MSEELGKHCDRIPASPLGNDVSLMATNLEAMLSSPSYVLADDDHELLERQEMRGLRMMLELQTPAPSPSLWTPRSRRWRCRRKRFTPR